MVYKIKKNVPIPPYMVGDEHGVYDTTLVNSKNELQVCPVDEFSGQPFMFNENGFIMNDVMVFENAESDSVARAALARIQILHPDNAPLGMTHEQLVHSIVPANFSTPAEYLRIQNELGKDYYNRIRLQAEKEQAAKVKPDTINFKEGE